MIGVSATFQEGRRDRRITIPGPVARTGVFLSLSLLLLALIGYPIVAIFGSFLQFEDNTLAAVFRAAVVLYCGGIIFFILSRVPDGARGVPPPSIVVFWLIYSARLAADYMTGQFPDLQTDALFFFIVCVIPAITLSVAAPLSDNRRIALPLVIGGGVVCALIILMNLTGTTGVVDPADVIEGRISLSKLNPITIGHTGVTTVLACAAVYLEAGRRVLDKVIAAVAGGIGLACLILAGSRGPLVSLVICAMIVLLVQRRWVILLALSLAALIATLVTISPEGSFVERLMSTGSDMSSRERLDIQAFAFQEFLQKPLTGNAYIETVFGFYSHNIILDAAMATGIVGLALILWIHFRTVVLSWAAMVRGEFLLPLIAIQYLAAIQFSGALVSSSEFWVVACMIIAQGNTSRVSEPIAPEDAASRARAR